METIGLRELNQNPSKAVARVRAGASLIVTDRGRPVLRMIPEAEHPSTLLGAGADHQRVPYFARQALSGVFLVDLTSTVLSRAMSYRLPRLGSLDAIQLASADPFRANLTELVTYDLELAKAASDLGFPASAPS
jgi:uncharacterized protein